MSPRKTRARSTHAGPPDTITVPLADITTATPPDDGLHGPYCFTCHQPICKSHPGYPLWALDGSYAVWLHADCQGVPAWVRIPVLGTIEAGAIHWTHGRPPSAG